MSALRVGGVVKNIRLTRGFAIANAEERVLFTDAEDAMEGFGVAIQDLGDGNVDSEVVVVVVVAVCLCKCQEQEERQEHE
jgi:hypothetical protein